MHYVQGAGQGDFVKVVHLDSKYYNMLTLLLGGIHKAGDEGGFGLQARGPQQIPGSQPAVSAVYG